MELKVARQQRAPQIPSFKPIAKYPESVNSLEQSCRRRCLQVRDRVSRSIDRFVILGGSAAKLRCLVDGMSSELHILPSRDKECFEISEQHARTGLYITRFRVLAGVVADAANALDGDDDGGGRHWSCGCHHGPQPYPDAWFQDPDPRRRVRQGL